MINKKLNRRQQNELLRFQSEKTREELTSKKNDLMSKKIKELEEVTRKHEEARVYLERLDREVCLYYFSKYFKNQNLNIPIYFLS